MEIVERYIGRNGKLYVYLNLKVAWGLENKFNEAMLAK